MNTTQRHIDDGAKGMDPIRDFPVKDGALLPNWIYLWWGIAPTRLQWGIQCKFVQLASLVGWEEVYGMIEYSATRGNDKMNYSYVEGCCLGRLQTKEKQEVKAKSIAQAKAVEKKYNTHCGKVIGQSEYGAHIDTCNVCREYSKAEVRKVVEQFKKEHPL